MKNKKAILGIGIVLLFTIFACLPLFGKGYIPTHDGEYHIIRFIEFFRMISEGYWFPRWAPTLNSGYGIPIFLFHYPLPNYIGSLFQLVRFNAVDAFKLSLASGYILSGILSFLWLKKLFGTKAGITGAIVSSYVPYWFVDLYIRGSVGEVWALMFLFAALFLFESNRFIPFCFSIAAIVLSHNILAMLFIPFLILYTVIRGRKNYIIGIVLGLLLSSYFWLPAIFERTFVVGLNTVNFREHFAQIYELLIPSWGTELSGEMLGGNKMSFQIGVVPLLILIGSFLVGFVWKKRFGPIHCYFFGILVISIFFMTPWSFIFWEKISMFQYIQYPWRLLTFIIPITGFWGAFISYHIRMRFISIVIIFLSVIFCYSYTRPVIYEPRDSHYYLSRGNFTDGTSSMGNSFSTIWTGWKNKRPEYVLEVMNGKVPGGISENSFLKKTFAVSSDIGASVSVPILYYPGWKVIVDKKDVPIDYLTDGTIRFFIPLGNHQVTVIFTQTPIRHFADLLSIVTLVWIAGWGILVIYAYRHKHIAFEGRAH